MSDQHVHHWRTEKPTGGRMKCFECGALYANGVVVPFEGDSEIVFIGDTLPDINFGIEDARLARFEEERERLKERPDQWAVLLKNISYDAEVSVLSEVTRRRNAAKEAGVGDKFKFAQRVLTRDPSNFYRTSSAVFGRYYPNGAPK